MTSGTWDVEQWQQEAACIERRDVDFFPAGDTDAETARALALCASCVVADNCLAFAIETNQTDGIWGGTTAGQHSKLRRVWLRDLRSAS